MTLLARSVVALTSAFALVATLILFVAHKAEMDGAITLGQSIWESLRYFTVLTNIVIGVFFLKMAVTGRWGSYSYLTACLVWISVVGLVYHILLSADHNPTGVLGLTNIAHHTLVPLGVLLAWIMAGNRIRIPAYKPFVWILWPLGYAAYILTRGAVEGNYPYFFIDPGHAGWGAVITSQIAISGLFLILGFLFRFIANRRVEAPV